MFSLKEAIVVGGIVTASVATVAAANAQQAYPEREIVLVVPYPAGGGVDSIARPIAEELQKRLGKPVVIENRASAGAVVGTEFVKNADPDGYTLLMASTSFVTGPILSGEGGYDPNVDFVKVGMMVNSPVVMLASKASGIATIADVVERGKSGKKLRYTSAGRFSGPALAAQSFENLVGIQMREVPYGSGSAIATAILSGETDVHFSSVPPVIGQVKADAVTTLGVASEKRLAALPDTPTMIEQGYKYAFGNPYGFFAPAGTPSDVVAVLEKAMAEVAENPDYRAKVEASGSEVKYMSSAAFTTEIEHQVEFWTEYKKQNAH
ncbi:tripartite tricarboxylate transporter substrate binding protein [Ensifer sp. ENS05]|uniref:tripartite tricarboxylate transporter substrate binding protein n=1 Tax=Ensifer sp. ENS05 TaxID=2769277 RepID=UPI0017862906|nr:tripartite tricarboxylate transporter substrate binding protein [Ensifer sp. ENS05]MBD9597306.1 tripartite tricarboxylate transporter substrate binding protein [Ensifer sp. ENS05]